MAKSVVSSGLSKRALVQLSYAIGVAKPLSLFVETYGTVRGAPFYRDEANAKGYVKKVALDESLSLEGVPKLILSKESENLKNLLTLQLYTMRSNIVYLTAKGAPFYRDEGARACSRPSASSSTDFLLSGMPLSTDF